MVEWIKKLHFKLFYGMCHNLISLNALDAGAVVVAAEAVVVALDVNRLTAVGAC